jgi:ABC-type polysaccharide/polyol phosphate transport system ATPase subunit
MAEPVIRVERLGKRYRVVQRERYRTLRDTLAQALKAPARLLARSPRPGRGNGPAHIWAVQDVSFEVEPGEVIGLIGRNGAGKTTLLKLLSRITKPTTGWAEIHGRVGSLLEVGTGFHPELSGRENVFLSGAVLGMKKREIVAKFDQIVDFSGVGDFIDTPLKHYSTGMQTRLAFAVAAHLEPEILLIDEVLAVGDLEFQKKCLGKMSEVARGGRTVLFVSHQMNQIRRLCERVLWIDRGQVRASGPTGEVVAAYETSQSEALDPTSGQCFLRWEIPGRGNVVRSNFEPVTLKFQAHLREAITRGHFGVAIQNDASLILIGWGFDGLNLPSGAQEIQLKISSLPLRPGVYTILCSLFNQGNNLTNGQLVDIWQAVPPLVVDTTPVSHPQERWAGVLNIPAELEVAGATALICGRSGAAD